MIDPFNVMENPPIIPGKREQLIQAVQNGMIPFAPSLMNRYGITPEECGVVPEEISMTHTTDFKPFYEVVPENYTGSQTIDNITTPHINGLVEFCSSFVDRAIKLGFDYGFVINECTVNLEFMKVYEKSQKAKESGMKYQIDISDFLFLYEAKAAVEKVEVTDD